MRIILAILAAMLTACTQIDTGNVGVIKTGGQFKTEELQPGWHFSLFSTVYEVSGKENFVKFDNMRPKTLDQITIEDLDIDIGYRMNAAKAQEIMIRLAGDLTTNSDKDYVPGLNYVSRAAREAIYNVASTIAAADAQAKRAAIPDGVQKALQKELDEKIGKDWFTVTNVNLRNLTVDSNLEKSIREAAQVKYEVDRKKQQIELAKAEAERQREAARGEADSMRIRAEALRSAQGPEYIKLLEVQNQAEAIKKWNGTLPGTVAGGAVPMIGLSK